MDLHAYARDVAPLPDEILHSYGALEPALVARPRSTDQVSRILAYANQHGVPVTPRGGGSSALGGILPIEGGLVLDLCGLNRVLEINETDATARVECGLSWRRLEDRLARHGLCLMAYPSSGVSATVGGYLGSGGGAGIGVPRNGVAGNSVLSMKVVLPDGAIVETNPWESWTFIGSEGTLGVICEATLKVARMSAMRCAMFAFDDLDAGLDALASLSRLRPFFLHFLDRGAARFLVEAGTAHLDDAALTVIAAFRGTEEELERVSQEAARLTKDKARTYPVEMAEKEWRNRFDVEISFKRLGPTLMVQEIRLPMSSLKPVMRELAVALEGYRWGVQCLSSDHRSICLLIYALTDERKKVPFYKALSLARAIPRIGYRHHGTVYGIALHNSSHLRRVHSREAVAVMLGLKRRFDPNNILNPSKTVHERVPGALVDLSMIFMNRFPALTRLGLALIRRLPKWHIRMGLRMLGGRTR